MDISQGQISFFNIVEFIIGLSNGCLKSCFLNLIAIELHVIISVCSALQLADISANQKAELMKLVNEAVHMLRPQATDDPDFCDFVTQVSDFRKTLAHVKPGWCCFP